MASMTVIKVAGKPVVNMYRHNDEGGVGGHGLQLARLLIYWQEQDVIDLAKIAPRLIEHFLSLDGRGLELDPNDKAGEMLYEVFYNEEGEMQIRVVQRVGGPWGNNVLFEGTPQKFEESILWRPPVN